MKMIHTVPPPQVLSALTTANWRDLSGRRDAERGNWLWQAGRYTEAADAFERSAALLAKTGLLVLAGKIHGALGLGLLAVDPARARENLRRAVAAAEAPVTGQHDRYPDVSVVYETLVWSLAGEVGTPRTGMTPPPSIDALHLVERSRSRQLLRMLGGTIPAPPDAHGHLYLAERAAADRYGETARQVEAARDQASALAAFRRFRAAADELDACRDDLRDASLAGAEYVQLRRGQPLTYDDIRELLASTGAPDPQAR